MNAAKPTLKSIQRFRTVQEIKDAMAHVFQDSQFTLSSHKKLVIVMKNIFNKSIELNYHEYFAMFFTKLLNKVLSLKKGEQVGDRIAKFCSSFIRSLNNDELEKRKKEKKLGRSSDEESDEEEEEDSHVDSFVKYLIHHLLRGIESKDRNVRYRVVQLLAYLVNQILEIDYESYQALYASLSRRLYDKEAVVRIQAIIALAKFQVYGFDLEDNEENQYDVPVSKEDIMDKIILAVKNDDSAEVRRAALINLTRNSNNIPHLIERARDVNSINRRLVYSRVSRELGDFRDFDFKHRENLLKWGLNDRDESVQKAAIKMFTYDWFETVNEDLLELVENLGVVDSEIAEMAMMAFYKNRTDKLSKFQINEYDWKELTTDKAFLIRTFYYHCNGNNLYDLIDANFPESVDLSETLKKYLDVRNNHLTSNESIVRNHLRHKQKIQNIDNQIFPIQTELIKLKYEIDHCYKNYNKVEHTINSLNYQINAYKKRKSSLENGEDQIQPSKEVQNDEQSEEDIFLSFGPEELQATIEETEGDIRTYASSLKKYENNIKIGEERFAALEKSFDFLSKEKANELNNFAKYSSEFIPFAEELKDLEFIIEQLLLISKEYDFSDEIGRRTMLQIIRSCLMDDNLSEKLIEIALKVLRKISINERDFTTMCTEIINDLRDSYENDDDTFHSAVSGFDNEEQQDEYADEDHSIKKRKVEPKQPPDDVIVQCLIITQHVLELAEEPLDHNLSLSSIRFSLVNYAIQQPDKVKIYSLGLKCLGLFTLLDQDSVYDSIQLFNIKLREGTEEIRIIAVKEMVDILSTYGSAVIAEKYLLYSIARNFHKCLNQFDMPNLQCVVAEGVCKLFLADIFSDSIKTDDNQDGFESAKQLFESLVLSYFHPLASKNQELRQILAFCIPVYAFSHPNHQIRLGSISGDCIFRMFMEDSDFVRYNNKLSPSTIIQQLIHWCDPNNLVNLTQDEIKKQPSHVFQAISFLQTVEQESPKHVKRAIINNLSKLSIHDELSSTVLEGLLNGVIETKECFELNKANSEFAFDKLTVKNFESFYQSIHDLHQKVIEREGKENLNTSNNSILSIQPNTQDIEHYNNKSIQDEDENKVDCEEKGKDKDESEFKNEDESFKRHSPIPPQTTEDNGQDKEVKDATSNSIEKANRSIQDEIDTTLQRIDKLLAEEDEVEYDISMSDD